MENCITIIEVDKDIILIDKKTINKKLKLVKGCKKYEPIRFFVRNYEKIGIKKQVKNWLEPFGIVKKC